MPSGEGLRSDAEPLQVGRIAAENAITLVELRPAEGAGLEELFLQLTANTQRDGQSPEQSPQTEQTEGALA